MKIKISVLAWIWVMVVPDLHAGPFDIIPLPASIRKAEGSFQVQHNTQIRYGAELSTVASYASGSFQSLLGFSLESVPETTGPLENCVTLNINQPADGQSGVEGYVLKITPQSVRLSANTPAGLFYGIQTLVQMLSGGDGKALPACVIQDYPRFAYRGMHLDVSRHFMPIEFVYKVIDYLAFHKMNVFHWHLTDDQGWRLEIKKYPKLTEVGAWRVDRENLHWNRRPAIQPGEKATYGGYYTQEQVKAVVKYAQSRHVTIIPEIEMPAHAMAALTAFPELSCTGINQGVPPGGVWPITHIFCAGKDETFEFLENILTEVMDLFPSDFIHVGGDEADKTEWKKCLLCQKRIKNEGLKNEAELQSYFIQRIEKFLNKNGRKLIGWDEILEGGLAPEASVMSWRGEEGGIAAAKMGHTVVMTPGSYCYFDYYQGNPALEPLAIGGNLTLKKVYSYEPVPKELNSEEGKFILGAQANLWTEYIPTPTHAEYMLFPRLAALAEVNWSPKGSRDWDDFSRRMKTQYGRYGKMGINYALSAYQVNAVSKLIPETKSLEIELKTEASNPEVRYTLDGSNPVLSSTLYTGPVPVSKSTIVKAAVFENGKTVTTPLSREFIVHQALASTVTLKFPNSPRYNASGKFSLVDGVKGSTNFADGNWKGFSKEDMVATIDLGKPLKINSIETDGIQDISSWVFLPKEVVFEVSSDGENYKTLGKVSHHIGSDVAEKITHDFILKKSAGNVRFIRVTSKNIGVCPKGHAGEGQAAWLFCSEIIVR
jgi:hexosaminidase